MESSEPINPEEEPISAEDADAREQEEAAAAEAGRIGGAGGADDVADEAQRPVAEGGGGEAEGFEEAEKQLIENTADMGSPDPSEFAGEPEAQRSDAEYGEADHEKSSEADEDAAGA